MNSQFNISKNQINDFIFDFYYHKKNPGKKHSIKRYFKSSNRKGREIKNKNIKELKKNIEINNESDYLLENKKDSDKRKKFNNKKKIYKNDDTCAICLNSMKGRKIKQTGCNHYFCSKCYDAYIYHHGYGKHLDSVCPLCRSNLYHKTGYEYEKFKYYPEYVVVIS